MRWLVLGMACALALGCGDDPDAEPAPLCSDEGGCPAGTRCVDGSMCVVLPGMQDRRDPPRFDLFRPGRTGAPERPRRRDAGAPLDGGPQDDGGLRRDAGQGQCLPGQALCTGGCASLQNDPNNCGACGIVCPDGQLCTLGVCCDSAGTVCDGECADVFTDRNNCGVCGFACDLGSSCVLGLCTPDDQVVVPGTDGPPGF